MNNMNPISEDDLKDVTGGANVRPLGGTSESISNPKVGRPSGGTQFFPIICPHCNKQITIPALNDVTCPECHKKIHISG